MITSFDIVYYLFYFICLYTALKAGKSTIPGLLFLQSLLVIGLVTEIVVEILQYNRANSNKPYYFYIPLEYACLVGFYIQNASSRRLKNLMLSSILLFILSAVYLTLHYHHFTEYPSVIYNLSCILNVIWISLLLFDFDMKMDKNIMKNPPFIILSAFLIFFAGIFFFNASYNYFLAENSGIANSLRNFTNVILNYILYLLLSYGFICSIKTRKY